MAKGEVGQGTSRSRRWAWVFAAMMMGAPLALPLVASHHAAEAPSPPPPETEAGPGASVEERLAEVRAEGGAEDAHSPAARDPGPPPSLASPPAREVASEEFLAPLRPQAPAFGEEPAVAPPGVEAIAPGGPHRAGPGSRAALAFAAPPLPDVPLPEVATAGLDFAAPSAAYAVPAGTDAVPADPLAPLDAATYAACAQLPPRAVVCAPTEVPFGTPALLDVDRDPTTGIAGADVLVELAPFAFPAAATVPSDPGAIPGLAAGLPAQAQGLAAGLPTSLQRAAADVGAPGIGVTLQVRVLAGPGDLAASPGQLPALRALPAKAWAAYGVAGAEGSQRVVLAGFDGTGDRLAMTSTVIARVTDPAQLFQGRLVGHLQVAFEHAGASSTAFGGAASRGAGGQAVDPTTVAVTLRPAQTLDVDLDVRLDGSQGSAVAQSAAQPRLTLTYEAHRSNPATTTIASATVAQMPSQLSLSFQRLSDGVRVVYDASQAVDLTATYDHASPAGRLTGTLAIPQLPKSIDVTVKAGAPQGSVAYRASSSIASLSGTFTDTARGLSGTAAIAGLPQSVDLAWDTAKGSASFVGSAGVGSIAGRVSTGGVVAGTDARDHIIVAKRAAGMGVDFRLSGLRGLAMADPSAGGAYSAEFTPGGQAFYAAYDDGDLAGAAEVSNLPARVAVDLRGGQSCAGYDASGPVASVKAQVQRASTGALALVELTALPSTQQVCWTTSPGLVVTSSASGPLGRVHAFVREGTGKATVDATLTSLPPWLRATAAGDLVTFDARTSASAAAGSASVGTILVKYASNGAFLTGTPSVDHLSARQTAAATQAELLYSGLQSFSVDGRNGQLHAALRNVAPLVFQASLDAPALLATLSINQVPASMTVDYVGDLLTYRASAGVGSVGVGFDTKAGPFVSVDVTGLPASVDLRLDTADQAASWTSSAPVPSLRAASRAIALGRTWDATVVLTGIPAAWDLALGGAHPLFRGVSGPIGSITGQLTNHGTATTFPGNHLSIVGTANGDLDASFGMAQVNLAEVQRTAEGYRADLRMGGGGALYLNANVADATARALVQATVSPLPSNLQVSQAGGVFRYDANVNFDLSAYTEVGHVSALALAPAPLAVRGISVRDGEACPIVTLVCHTAVKARVFLQGFPTMLRADAATQTFSMTNFRPPATGNFLTFDAALTALVPGQVSFKAVQLGIPVGVAMTFGPFTSTAGAGGARVVDFHYDVTAPMGRLTVDVGDGAYDGQLVVSNIPARLDGTATLGKDLKTISLDFSQGIDQVEARVKKASSGAWQGEVVLGDVPRLVELSFGSFTSIVRYKLVPGCGSLAICIVPVFQTTPGLQYTGASAVTCIYVVIGGKLVCQPLYAYQHTLDILADVDAALFDGDVKGYAQLDMTDLAGSTQATLQGKRLVLASNTATTVFDLRGWASVPIDEDFDGCTPGCGAELHAEYTGHVTVDPLVIRDFHFRATAVRSLTLTTGLTSAVQGTYGTFTLGFGSLSAPVDLELRFKYYAFGNLIGSSTMPHQNFLINGVKFWQSKNTTERILHLPVIDPCGSLWNPGDRFMHVDVTPVTSGSSTNSVTVSSASASGGAWLITAEPLGPGISTWSQTLANLVAAKTDPFGDGLDVYTHCHTLF